MLCSLGFGRHTGMTAEKGKFMKKTAAVVAGTLLALGGAAPAFADAGAQGAAVKSPGVLSGNVIQIPVHVPINLCGNSIDVIALLNPTFGNTCVNG
ncbi:membrane protein [Streptomyces fuscichromogenes]|uniref:Membrane protein n=2 Tax=Streptomyces fuscichromogenes TaxID=1324013 RepID=A0A917UGQ5_9ACTN|nr:membrane protein [Streptomyces fuscichromogenes]